MLKMTHHSGRARWLNYEQIESVERDDQGQTVIRMSSGQVHVAMEEAPAIIADMDEWYKTEMPKSAPRLITMKEGK